MDKKNIILVLKFLQSSGFEVVKSNSGQIALNNKEGTQPFVAMNDIGYLTPTPYQWHLIENEIKRLEQDNGYYNLAKELGGNNGQTSK